MKKAILILLAFALLVGVMVYFSKQSKEAEIVRETEMTSREVAMLCTTDMATEFHIHPTITIFIDGVEYPLPANIGITPSCMHSIHTHSDMPVVHVEAPVAKDFTLGDFFAVWGKSFDATHLLDIVATKPGQITVTVNGTSVDTFEATILRDKEAIVISYQAN